LNKKLESEIEEIVRHEVACGIKRLTDTLNLQLKDIDQEHGQVIDKLRDFIYSETFIDSIVGRIKRKQLS